MTDRNTLETGLLAVIASTGAALMQTIPSDDQIIIGHLRDADAEARALLRQVHEDTIERYHEIGQSDLEGKQGAYARGRCIEAKSIARAIDEVCRSRALTDEEAGGL